MCIRWKKATVLKNWHWIFVLMRAALVAISPYSLFLAHEKSLVGFYDWPMLLQRIDDSWIHTPINPSQFPWLPWKEKGHGGKHGGFQGPNLEVRHTTSNHDPSPSTWSHSQLQENLRNILYLSAQKKTGNSLSHDKPTWKLTLKSCLDDQPKSAEPCWTHVLHPASSEKQIVLIIEKVTCDALSFSSAHRCCSQEKHQHYLVNRQSCVLPSWTHHPGGYLIQ